MEPESFNMPTRPSYSIESHNKVDTNILAHSSRFMGAGSIAVYDMNFHEELLEEHPDPYDLIEVLSETVLADEGALKIKAHSDYKEELQNFEKDHFKFHVVEQKLVLNKLGAGDNSCENSDVVPDEERQFYKNLSSYFRTTRMDINDLPKTAGGLPIDLYALRKRVNDHGGFDVVSSRKLWHQVGKELGLPGKVIRKLYFEVLLQFASWLYTRDDDNEDELESSEELNENNKRNHVTRDDEESRCSLRKRPNTIRYETTIPTVTNSKPISIRSRAELLVKGYKTNFESYFEDSDDEKFRNWQGEDIDVLDRTYPKSAVVSSNYTLDRLQASDSTVSLKDAEMFLTSELETSENHSTYVSHSFSSRLFKSGFKERSDHPWNLNNIGSNLKGILHQVSSNQGLSSTKLHVNGNFGITNWQLQDHLTYAIDYLHKIDNMTNGTKLWFFIAPEDRKKYEDILRELSGEKKVQDDDPNFDCNPVFPFLEMKPDPNTDLQKILAPELVDEFNNINGSKTSFRTDVFLTPSMLHRYGIKLKHTVQEPGDYILLTPNCYSFSISLGVTLSESVNFAPIDWVSQTCFEGEQYMASHNIIPAFSSFELLQNVTHSNSLYEEGLDSLSDILIVLPSISRLMEREKFLSKYINTRDHSIRVNGLRLKYEAMDEPLSDDICDLSLRTCGLSVVVFRRSAEIDEQDDDGDDDHDGRHGETEEFIDLVVDAYTFFSFLQSQEAPKLNLEGYKLCIYQDESSFRSWKALCNTLPKLIKWGASYSEFLGSVDPTNDKTDINVLIRDYEEIGTPIVLYEYQLLKKIIRSGTSWLKDYRKDIEVFINDQPHEDFFSSEQVKQLLFQSQDIPFSLCPERLQLYRFSKGVSAYDENARQFLEECEKLGAQASDFVKSDRIRRVQELYEEGLRLPVRLEVTNFLGRILQRAKWVNDFNLCTSGEQERYPWEFYVALYKRASGNVGLNDRLSVEYLWDKLKNGDVLSSRIEEALKSKATNLRYLKHLEKQTLNVPIKENLLEKFNQLVSAFCSIDELVRAVVETIETTKKAIETSTKSLTENGESRKVDRLVFKNVMYLYERAKLCNFEASELKDIKEQLRRCIDWKTMVAKALTNGKRELRQKRSLIDALNFAGKIYTEIETFDLHPTSCLCNERLPERDESKPNLSTLNQWIKKEALLCFTQKNVVRVKKILKLATDYRDFLMTKVYDVQENRFKAEFTICDLKLYYLNLVSGPVNLDFDDDHLKIDEIFLKEIRVRSN